MRAHAALFLTLAAIAASACGGDDGDNAAQRPDLIVYEGHATDDSVDLYTIDPVSGETERLTNDGNSKHPGWSPDRTQIVYASSLLTGGADEDIYVLDVDSRESTRLTSTDGVNEWTPKFSPDARQITFVETTDAGSTLMVMDADGSNPHALTDLYQSIRFPVWSPDAATIYFAGLPIDAEQGDIFAVSSEGGEVRTVVATKWFDSCPHMMPDGSSISYGSIYEAPGQEPNLDLFRHDLSNPDTSGATDVRLTQDPRPDDYGDPSQTGYAYVFVRFLDGNADLFVIDADGGNERRLTTTPGIKEDAPNW